jgi:PAS domain S-box-containing protein
MPYRIAPTATITEHPAAPLEAIYNAMRDALAVFDMTGRRVLGNPALARLWGYADASQMETEVRKFPDIFSLRTLDGRELPFEEWPVNRILRGESIDNEELWVRRRDTGREWIISFRGQPARDENGSQILAVIVGRDVTEQKQAEQALRASHDTFRHLVEGSPFGVCAVDADFRLVQVSQGAQKVFENVRPLIGRDFAEALRIIWPEEFATEAIGHFRNTLATGEPYHAPASTVRRADTADVESYDWKIERLMLPDGRMGVVCHFYDLSERQRYEAALRDADRRKDEFIAMLGHELRNPLGPIRNAVQILNVVAAHEPTARQARQMIDRQSAHMARLIDDLLDVARITRGTLHIRKARCDLAEIVRNVAEDYRPQMESAGLRLNVEVPGQSVWVNGDATRLNQIIGNVLHNSMKFTDAGGYVSLQLLLKGDACEIQIRDSGIGMDAVTVQRMFQTFNQADSSLDRSRGGLGLGMALVKHLVELHEGGVQARSEGVGHGSDVVIRIPVELVDAPSSTVVASPQAADRKLRILVIEDNVDAAESLCILLHLKGHVTEKAGTGPAGIMAAQTFLPDVVLCDLGLPGLDGSH